MIWSLESGKADYDWIELLIIQKLEYHTEGHDVFG